MIRDSRMIEEKFPLRVEVASQAFLLRLKSGRHKNPIMRSRQLLLTTMPRVHLRKMPVAPVAPDAGNGAHMDVVYGAFR